VATPSVGISVTWGGTPFAEVTELSWSYGNGAAKGRGAAWTDDLGSVTVSSLGTANMTTSQYGQRKQLVITGGGANLTTYAVYESLSVAPELNGVTRYAATFKILDG
jgi:hypothetical protein